MKRQITTFTKPNQQGRFDGVHNWMMSVGYRKCGCMIRWACVIEIPKNLNGFESNWTQVQMISPNPIFYWIILLELYYPT